ncbi:uncharacterized protein LOC142564838 [Dermacentor variabilis]|uniref:uncharacterized protein LOC142564838 n=1 Tax=Dermacentor variabilis TaxID=34621 RepID=UPI003F5C1F8D
MNTSWPIWTYETTRNTNFFCQVDNVLNITEKSVCFNRSYWSSNWTTDTLEGTFDTSDLSTMLVGGIAGPGWRELRFKDVNETGKPEKECLDYFNKTGKAGYVIYRDNCTDLSLSVWPEY